MRRFILIFMMVLLPLQWSWAAAAAVCAHESGNAHFGHHEHHHVAMAGDAEHDHADDSLGNHPDCQVCHGIGAGVVRDAEPGMAAWVGARSIPLYERTLPEPPVESFLRPPLTLVA